ncbi:hypothetical protein BHM03_00052366 [Ensete ventricosum]|uniref:Uncharacterized protein n=1 Tax=Ensete ventricosum TaxID=4639 RepID=A0A445MLV6_ENSVE|nr:hypothetical protein BHM03_00052366 [Ensete ventricosum]
MRRSYKLREVAPRVEFRLVLRAPSRKFKILAIHDLLAHGKVEFRSVFRAPSRKFKILVFPVLLAHGKSYKHAFARNCDVHKHYAKSRPESIFDRFFLHCLGNSKYWSFPSY